MKKLPIGIQTFQDIRNDNLTPVLSYTGDKLKLELLPVSYDKLR
jgi:hypothetical protein